MMHLIEKPETEFTGQVRSQMEQRSVVDNK